MAQMHVIPTKQTLEAWENNSVTDSQLEIMLGFLEYMYLGCHAMGESYALASNAFSVEYIRALNMTNRRKRESNNQNIDLTKFWPSQNNLIRETQKTDS